MSLFRKPLTEEKRSINSLPWSAGGDITNHGEISQDQALKLAPVFAAGNLLASTIASLPIQTFRRTKTGRSLVTTPQLFQKPSVIGTVHDWVYRAVLSMAYRGNAVGLVTSRDGMGFPTNIEWLRPDWVTVLDGLPEGPGSFTDPVWYYRGRVMDPASLVHIPWFVLPWKVWGLTPLSAFATTVNTALSAQVYKDDWFKSGGVPPGQFKNAEQIVDQTEAQTIKSRLVSAIRTHEPLVYGKDWDYTPFTLTHSDAQFVETMQLSATQVANVYGIPPSRIGGITGETMRYANVEQDSINLIQWAILPWVSRIEGVFNQLLPTNQYVKFDLDSLVRPDTAARFAAYQIARNIGISTVNEIRDRENQPPVDGGDDPTPLAIQIAAAGPQGSPEGAPEPTTAPSQQTDGPTEGGAGR